MPQQLSADPGLSLLCCSWPICCTKGAGPGSRDVPPGGEVQEAGGAGAKPDSTAGPRPRVVHCIDWAAGRVSDGYAGQRGARAPPPSLCAPPTPARAPRRCGCGRRRCTMARPVRAARLPPPLLLLLAAGEWGRAAARGRRAHRARAGCATEQRLWGAQGRPRAGRRWRRGAWREGPPPPRRRVRGAECSVPRARSGTTRWGRCTKVPVPHPSPGDR